MTLTQDDLQAIGNLIGSKLEPVKQELANVGNLIDQKLEPVKQELANVGNLIDQKLDNKLKPIKQEMQFLASNIKILEKGQKKILKELRLVTKIFDRDVSYHGRCIKDLYQKTGYPQLPPPTF